MSEILIRGMEMPGHCGECKLKAEYDDETFCPFFADNVEYWIAAGRRHEDCPLGYIPPHGDLIDRDALRDNNCNVFEINGADGTILAMDVSIIDAATTIIQASK